MQSTLIRYTNSRYAASVLRGELSLSSLSSFWDFKKGKISRADTAAGKVTPADIERARQYDVQGQQDFSEGIGFQVPHRVLDRLMPADMVGSIIHDARFRVEAYGYCNLLCFFRVDAQERTETKNMVSLDADSLALLAREKGIRRIASYEDVCRLSVSEKARLIRQTTEPNPLLNPERSYIVQLPGESMDGFGDVVMVVKNEGEFISRVLAAVKRQGGECVMGDVRYHEMIDRMDPGTIKRNSLTMISGPGEGTDDLFDLVQLLEGESDILRYGCLDKYERYAQQKEWRICWLPEKHNYERKTLHVGDLTDIVDLVETKEIRRYLLKRYSGYWPGIVSERRQKKKGTIGYQAFKEKVETIDGKCRIIFEIG